MKRRLFTTYTSSGVLTAAIVALLLVRVGIFAFPFFGLAAGIAERRPSKMLWGFLASVCGFAGGMLFTPACSSGDPPPPLLDFQTWDKYVWALCGALVGASLTYGRRWLSVSLGSCLGIGILMGAGCILRWLWPERICRLEVWEFALLLLAPFIIGFCECLPFWRSGDNPERLAELDVLRRFGEPKHARHVSEGWARLVITKIQRPSRTGWTLGGAFLVCAAISWSAEAPRRTGSQVGFETHYGDIPMSTWKDLPFVGVFDGSSRNRNPGLPPEVLGIWNPDHASDFFDALEREHLPAWSSAPRIFVPWGKQAGLLLTRPAVYPSQYSDPGVLGHASGVNAVDHVRVPVVLSETSQDEIGELLECRVNLVPQKSEGGRTTPLVALELHRPSRGREPNQKDSTAAPVLKLVLEDRQNLVLERWPATKVKCETTGPRSKRPSVLSLVLVSVRVFDEALRPVSH